VFFDVFRVFCVFICGNTAKHSQNTAKHPQNITKHPQNNTKHHKTHLLTKQPEFANKPALALSIYVSGYVASFFHVSISIAIVALRIAQNTLFLFQNGSKAVLKD